MLLGEASLKAVANSGTHPRGGFTDVGLHTGGAARGTCWPLVREVHRHLLSFGQTSCADPDGLQRRFLAQFELWLTERRCETVVLALSHQSAESSAPPFDNSAILVDSVVQMLETAVSSASAMVADGYSLPGFEMRCKRVKDQLNEAMTARQARDAAFYVLPTGTAWATNADGPTVVLPPMVPASGAAPSLSSTQKLAQNFVQWVPLLDRSSTDGTITPLENLLEWMARLTTGNDDEAKIITIMGAVEQTMYAHAATLGAGEQHNACALDGRAVQLLIERYVHTFGQLHSPIHFVWEIISYTLTIRCKTLCFLPIHAPFA